MRRIGRRYPKVLNQSTALARDEITGEGLFKGKTAEDNRRHELEQQIKIWEALKEKLDDNSTSEYGN